MKLITLENPYLALTFHPRGAAISNWIYKPLDRNISLHLPDRNLAGHYGNTVVGPLANRVKNARFVIEGEAFALDANEGANTLHGGTQGLSEIEWDLAEADTDYVRFAVTLADGHGGFPGPTSYSARYRLNGATLEVTFEASAERAIAVNLAPHFYFNLAGGGTINDHIMTLHADHYLPVDKVLLPTGQIAPLANTVFDFRMPRPIGHAILDHNFCIRGGGMRAGMTLAVSDLTMRVISDQPGLQIYDGRHIGRQFMAIEPQGWPNAVNQPHFPSPILKAGEFYRTRSQFIFG